MSRPSNPDEYIARAVAAFEAGFKTLTAKKDALADLSTAYGAHRNRIMELCLEWQKTGLERMPEDQNEVYWGLPHDLHNYRPKHTTMVLKVFPQMAPTCAQMEKLVELRKQINGAEVAPKGPSKAQREESIRLSATGKAYQAEFGKMQPELEKDFTDYIEGKFKRLAGKYGLEMVKKLGPVYGRWGAKMPEDVSESDYDTYKGIVQRFLTDASLKGGAPQIDRARLSKEAESYAKHQIAQFVIKLTQKLGDLTTVAIKRANAGSFEYVIEGDLRGHRILVKQDRKFVVNQQGTMFHQWPALIYVDGKFTTEAAFKRLSAGA